MTFDYVYYWKKYKPEYHGLRCAVLARGTGPGPRNLLIEFEDGYRMVTPRFSARPVKRKDR